MSPWFADKISRLVSHVLRIRKSRSALGSRNCCVTWPSRRCNLWFVSCLFCRTLGEWNSISLYELLRFLSLMSWILLLIELRIGLLICVHLKILPFDWLFSLHLLLVHFLLILRNLSILGGKLSVNLIFVQILKKGAIFEFWVARGLRTFKMNSFFFGLFKIAIVGQMSLKTHFYAVFARYRPLLWPVIIPELLLLRRRIACHAVVRWRWPQNLCKVSRRQILFDLDILSPVWSSKGIILIWMYISLLVMLILWIHYRSHIVFKVIWTRLRSLLLIFLPHFYMHQLFEL